MLYPNTKWRPKPCMHLNAEHWLPNAMDFELSKHDCKFGINKFRALN